MRPPKNEHIVNHWLTRVITDESLVSMVLPSIRVHTGISTFEELIIMKLLQLPFIPLVIWIINRLDQLSLLCTIMYIMERGIPFNPM